MTSTADNTAIRRKQVLDAARERFAADGFHGSNMAAIAKTARMSVGHIYHYFENKEAIIAAIVEDDLARMLGIFDEVQDAQDVENALADRVDRDMTERMASQASSLELEILAEAARNPVVAQVVRDADTRMRTRVRELFERNPAFGRKSPIALEARIELVGALFDGLVVRAVRHPSVDRKTLLAAVHAFHNWLHGVEHS